MRRGQKAIPIIEPSKYVRDDGSIGVLYDVRKVFDVETTARPCLPRRVDPHAALRRWSLARRRE
ncbi:MAG: hypothetical protein ACLSVD_01835 [Eggerthellaceae bacterium]